MSTLLIDTFSYVNVTSYNFCNRFTLNLGPSYCVVNSQVRDLTLTDERTDDFLWTQTLRKQRDLSYVRQTNGVSLGVVWFRGLD